MNIYEEFEDLKGFLGTKEGFKTIEGEILTRLGYIEVVKGSRAFSPLHCDQKVRGIAIDRETWHYALSEDEDIAHMVAVDRLLINTGLLNLSDEEKAQRILQGFVIPHEKWARPLIFMNLRQIDRLTNGVVFDQKILELGIGLPIASLLSGFLVENLDRRRRYNKLD